LFVSFFESCNSEINSFEGRFSTLKQRQAATTGQNRGHLPASSIPIFIFFCKPIFYFLKSNIYIFIMMDDTIFF
jgi:hypothetical protein